MRWWLSFAGPRGFNGASVVEADTMVEAVRRAHRLGINPGGQVVGVELGDEFPAEIVDRALTPEEIAKYGEGEDPPCPF